MGASGAIAECRRDVVAGASVAPAGLRTVPQPDGRRSGQRGSQFPDTKQAGNPDGDGSKPRGKGPKKPAGKRTRAAKRKLDNVVRLVQRSGGQLQGGQRELARRLKVSRSRANELLHEAARAGLLAVETSRQGTRVALAGDLLSVAK
jgi:flagellar motor protein MotB